MIIFIVQLVDAVFTILFWMIIAHIILSWLPKDNPTLSKINEIVDSVVLPMFAPFRKIVPVIDLGGMGFDLTPIVVLIFLQISQSIILQILRML